MLDYIMNWGCYIILVIFVLIGVAFLTLLERKVLGYIQIRKGPNKVGMLGLPQPFADAIKLFCSEQTYPITSNYLMYFFCPVVSLFLSLLVWIIYPVCSELISFDLALLFFFCCTGMGVYAMMLAGWSSNSNYALLGGLRAVAQTISYEVSLALILLSFIILVGGFGVNFFYINQMYIWFFFLCVPLFFCWFSSCLAETNRTPFDFSEGESELVSGFNVEYSSGGFALIFMAEYSSILFMSMLTVLIFFGGNIYSIYFYFMLVFLSFMFIWIRGTLPRFRYDKLMYLAWKSYLPVSLNYFIFFCCFSYYMMCIMYWDILGKS
uniref:NADH-ubiquinone oxidoreductase chain 1 n=1 Tax=Tarbinskiellus portentosus TaxID=2732766 RepID=A0A8F9RYH1_9ORTH|nr:NADH dehydrogenase subunit 1 [Tarbinskiellus portentosus]UBU97854.1 NADH dehydrogenase subunit 1 [Tarbinskiellus sp.]DAZ85814.1 TPA_asm: NADH dehydrogenase subunit 1 [Tarbinskiellus portentosus]